VNQRMLMNILWMAFFFSVVMYHALIVSNAVPPEGGPHAGMELFGYIFLFLGIFQLLVIINLDIFLIGRPRKLRVGADILQGREVPEDPAQFAQAAKATYLMRLFILVCALAEASGLYGLVLYMLGGPVGYAHALMGIAYVSLIYVWLRMHYCWEAMYLE
jgi:hypothetical protein